MRRLLGLVVLALVATVCGACNAVLTPDGTPYTFTSPAPGTVVVTAASTSGNNNRQLFWSQASPVEADSVACATFESGQGIDQQGVALRIANGHALVIERNIFADVFNDFAFIEWTGNGAFTIFGTVNVPSLPVAPAVYPLTLCAKITGDTMSFVESSPGQTGGGSAPIPSSAPATGQAGFYVGHVVPGTSTNLTHLTVGSQTPEDQHDSVCTSFLSSGMTLATTWALC